MMIKKVRKAIVYFVMLFCLFNKVIATTHPIEIKFGITKNILDCNEQVEATLYLQNIKEAIKIKEIHAYLDYDQAVFETVHEDDVKIFGVSISNTFHERSKKMIQKCDLEIKGNVAAIQVNLKVKEQTKVKQGYIYLRQLYLIDENNEKIELNDCELAVKVKQNNPLLNSSKKIADTMENSMTQDRLDSNYILFQNINLLKIPVEGFAIILYSLIVVVMFHFFVKTVIQLLKYCKEYISRKNSNRRAEQIIKNIKYYE